MFLSVVLMERRTPAHVLPGIQPTFFKNMTNMLIINESFVNNFSSHVDEVICGLGLMNI